MKPLSSDRSQRQQSLRYKKFYLRDRCHCDLWRVVSIWSLNYLFSVIAAIIAIVAIIWKPGLIYRNNRPPFPLNCYLYALQTYRTHSSKLRLLLVYFLSYKTPNQKHVSLRSKRFHLVSKQRKTGCGRARWNGSQKMKVPFLARSLTLVLRSLLLNCTETLATQAKNIYVCM